MTEDEVLARADAIRARRAYQQTIDDEFAREVQIVSFDRGGERVRFDLDETAKGWLKAHMMAIYDKRNGKIT